MKISLNWLKDYVDFDPKLTVEEIKWRLTEATAEIEGIIEVGKGLDRVVVGELVESKKHPDADKLSIGTVKISPKESIQVIYGNKAEVKIGDKVPTAIAPCELHGGTIEVGKIRGIQSEGMLCLDSELIEGASESLTTFDAKTKVGTPITDLLPIQDHVFEIDNHSITHRSDLFSHYGFARECVALGLGKWKRQLKAQDPKKLVGKKASPVKVVIKDKQISKNYFGTALRGLSVKPAPDWMKYRLEAVGVRSINAIVDITNYVMMDVGQPNHAFDLRILEGKTFTNRLSKKGEKVTTLDGIERSLDEGIIIAETEDSIVDLAGIMGAENSEIKDDTTDVYFHSVQFDNVMIRKAMISLGHRTDGGTMHEKDIEAERSAMGFVRGIELFSEVYPEAKAEYELIHIQNDQTPEAKISLPFEKFTAHIGLEVDPKKGKQYLEDLGFTVKLTKNSYEAVSPSWRANSVTIPEDLIEEIIRIHGYSEVPAIPPTVELATPVKNHKRHTRRTIQKFLTGLGFQEEVNFSFLSEALLTRVGQFDQAELIEITNPVTDDFRYMRPSFLAYMLDNASRNLIVDDRAWKTFEMGAVYTRKGQEITEQHRLTLMLTGEESFHNLRTITQQLFDELTLELSFSDAEREAAYPGRCQSLTSDEKVIGEVFQVHPALLENYKISSPITVLDINLDELYRLAQRDVHCQPLNRHPKAHLDINVVVDEKTRVEFIQDLIASVQGEYLTRADLIDVYAGKNLGEGKKSFTFALSYQHPERTLEEQEIQAILEKLISTLEKSGGTVRR